MQNSAFSSQKKIPWLFISSVTWTQFLARFIVSRRQIFFYYVKLKTVFFLQKNYLRLRISQSKVLSLTLNSGKIRQNLALKKY